MFIRSPQHGEEKPPFQPAWLRFFPKLTQRVRRPVQDINLATRRRKFWRTSRRSPAMKPSEKSQRPGYRLALLRPNRTALSGDLPRCILPIWKAWGAPWLKFDANVRAIRVLARIETGEPLAGQGRAPGHGALHRLGQPPGGVQPRREGPGAPGPGSYQSLLSEADYESARIRQQQPLHVARRDRLTCGPPSGGWRASGGQSTRTDTAASAHFISAMPET